MKTFFLSILVIISKRILKSLKSSRINQFWRFLFIYSEEKCEQIESLRDEIDEVKKQVNKLRNENVDLQQKAALANVYSDELESLREKVK